MRVKRCIAMVIIVVMLTMALPVTSLAEAENTSTSQLTEKQLNSLVMLNYLTVLTQEINASSNSRLYIEEVYSTLNNNTRSNVDKETQYYFNTLMEILEAYRLIDVKRERLEFIYEQNKAEALRAAVPNPLALLSAVQSLDMKRIVASVIYMAVDSISSYESASTKAELDYLKDGWELDDQAAATLATSRTKLFNYIFDMAREYQIPDELTLREKQVEDLVKYENNPNVVQRIQFLEDEQSTYQAYGGYWLILAKSYYENGDYYKCLQAVAKYEGLNVGIFRKDYDYARILPLAICALEETKNVNYVSRASQYAQLIEDNTLNSDWDLRYIAAQTYIDLFAKTSDSSYLVKAYNLIRKNIVYLVDEQHILNHTYLADIIEIKPEKNATKAEKTEIKQYNKMLRETREKELPPISQALLLNCDLLFALADEINISQSERTKIEGILHPNGEALFLISPIDNTYRFNAEMLQFENISFDGEKLYIPAEYVSSSAKINVSVKNSEIIEFSDWQLSEVERKMDAPISTFMCEYTSQEIKKASYSPDSVVIIEIIPTSEVNSETISVTFKVSSYRKIGFITSVKFEKVET